MAETLRIFGFINRWPGMTCVPLTVVLADEQDNIYAVYPGEGFTRGPLTEDGDTLSTLASIRERETFVSSEGTPYEMKDWQEGQVAYLDRHGNPRVGLWKELTSTMREDVPHITSANHQKMLADMLKQSV